MITAEFEIELLCFMREFEAKGYRFNLLRNTERNHPEIIISVVAPAALKIMKAKQSSQYDFYGKNYYKSSQEDLEQFMHTVKLYDKTYNKRAA